MCIRDSHYAEALRELFELKPGAAEAVSAPESGLGDKHGVGETSADQGER